VDGEDAIDGAPELHRQERVERRDAAGRRLVPSRIPETRPPLLGDWFIYLSIVVLVCGVVAITALELGAGVSSAVVRLPALLGATLIILLSIDAMVRVWRSAWAWLPVDRGRGLFRFVWAATLAGIVAVAVAIVAFLLIG
jgi:hypothetical protein